MIKIEHVKDTILKCSSTSNQTLRLLFSSFLSAKWIARNRCYHFDVREFDKLRQSCDTLGFKERAMTKEVEEVLGQYIERQELLIKIKNEKQSFPSWVKFKTTPFEEQKNGTCYLKSCDKAGIFDEMGLGKTKQVLDTLYIWRKDNKVDKGIVICPNTAKFSWTDQIIEHSNFSSFEIGNGTPKCKEQIKHIRVTSEDNQPDLFIVHMDSLRHINEELATLKPSFLIIDEFHYFKNTGNSRKAGAQRTESLFNLAEVWQEKTPGFKVIIMTGTPVGERPEEAFAVFQMLAPSLVSSYSRFINRFCEFQPKRIGRRIIREKVRNKNLGELKELLESVGIRRLKSEVEGFPEKLESTRYVVLKGDHKAGYETVRKATYAEIIKLEKAKQVFNVKNKFIRLMQVVNNPALLDGANVSNKYEEVDIILEEVLSNPDEKVILWSMFRRSIELLYDRIHKIYGADCIYGAVPNEDRPAIVHRFQNDKLPRVLICNPQAAGVSLNLQRASTAIYVDQMFELTARLQSEDRIHRRTSKGTVNIINIVAKDTIDEYLVVLLQRKRNIKDALLTTDEQLIESNREHLLSYLK